MDPDEQQKRKLDRPRGSTPDPAAFQKKHTENFHSEALREDNDTIQPQSSEDCSNEVHTPAGTPAAEKFFNIPEFRVMLYETIANSATSPVGDFSGLFLSCRKIYAEAETEIVESRTKYIDAEDSKWSEIWGLPVTISKPRYYRDLNTSTVTVTRNCHMPQSYNLYGYRGLWGHGNRNPQWPLRDLALPRLEIALSIPDATIRNGSWQQIRLISCGI
jgi:hypothetical protein